MLLSLLLFSVLTGLYLLLKRLDRRRQHRKAPKATGPLDRPLMLWSESDALTLRDLLNGGIIIMGRTGSGKTSSSGRCIAEAIVRAKAGMLVLTAKHSDLPMWRASGERAGRAD